MDGDRIAMSQRERDRLKVMAAVLEGRRTQAEAARLMGVTDRTVRRWQRRLEEQGDGGIVHRLRGRPSNRRCDPGDRQAILKAYRDHYVGFGPTLAAEKLAAREGLWISDESLRRWLLAEGLWRRRRRRDRHRQRRQRRPCFGELVQADGSHHDWLEGRGETMVLLVMIDDATSRALARFYPAETTEAYMDLLGRYLRKRGRPVEPYTDKDSVFWGQAEGKRAAQTQFSRALGELRIQLILAHSPQAKGRVERFNQTAQDRLVKELRLAGACTMKQSNVVVETVFLPWFNRHCTVTAASPNNAHRPLHPSMNLKAILSLQEQRVVANDYTVQLDNKVYQLPPPALPGLRGGTVTIERRLDGSLKIRFKGQYLKYKLVAADRPTSGALPPNPRSLSNGRTPAEPRKKAGQAVVAAGPSAVRPAGGLSGRTPAEPCLPDGAVSVPEKGKVRPPGWAWRTFRLPGSLPKNRTILMGQTTGQF